VAGHVAYRAGLVDDHLAQQDVVLTQMQGHRPSRLLARSLANSVLEFDDSGVAGDERGCGGLT